jgi:hypothetical protein
MDKTTYVLAPHLPFRVSVVTTLCPSGVPPRVCPGHSVRGVNSISFEASVGWLGVGQGGVGWEGAVQ